jgi:hypothetical protein
MIIMTLSDHLERSSYRYPVQSADSLSFDAFDIGFDTFSVNEKEDDAEYFLQLSQRMPADLLYDVSLNVNTVVCLDVYTRSSYARSAYFTFLKNV